MQRSALKNKANDPNDPLVTKPYKEQRNHLVNLNGKAKKDFFQKDMQRCKPFINKMWLILVKPLDLLARGKEKNFFF